MTVRIRILTYAVATTIAIMVASNVRGRAATPLDRTERLRRLARLPRVELNLCLTFNPFNGFDLLYDKLTIRREAEGMKLRLSESQADAMSYVQFGRFCRELGDSGTANVAFLTAARLFERQGAENSVDGKILATYGEAIAGTGRADEAERVLRRSVRVSEFEWRVHAALGRLLTERVTGWIGSGRAAIIGPGHDPGWFTKSPGSHVSLERLERMRSETADAISALNRAIELGPTEVEPRVWRAAAGSASCYVEAMSGALEGGRQEPVRQLAKLLPAEVTVHLAEAARLSQTNARVLGMSAIYPLLRWCSAASSGGSRTLAMHEAWGLAPDDVRAQVWHALGRLDALTEAAEPRTAAAAMEMLGMLQLFVLRDTHGAERNLRRVGLLDPERGQDALAVLLVDSGRWLDLVEFCEEQLKIRDDVRIRLLFANGLGRLGRIDEMTGVVLETHRRYPERFDANMALALTLIRVSGEPVVLAQAMNLILRAEKAAGEVPTGDQLKELLFARGLVLGLKGDVDQARSCLGKVIELEPENRQAREALEIIDAGGRLSAAGDGS